jgi:outer membrane protein
MIAALLSLALAQPAQKIDVEEGVQLALRSSPQLRGVQLRTEAAHDQANALRGRMLPLISLSEEWLRYDKPFSIQFEIPGAPAGPGLTVRNLITNSFAASVNQPLLGLIRTLEEHASLGAGAEGMQEAARGLEAAIREAVESGYLRYFEALAAQDIALTSQHQLEEQLQLVAARLKAGTATNADKLRLDVAISNAKLQHIQAQAQATTARTALLLAMGLDPSQPIELLQPTALEQRALPQLSEADARETAAQQRPEVMRAMREQASARYHARASYLALLPEVGVEGVYTNLRGQAFAPPDQFYVGLKAQWAVWEWGATFYAARAADKNAQAAAMAVEEQALNVKSEASARWVQARSAASAIEAAQTIITSAEEAYRVEQALVNAGSATTTDLLDAQSSLTQAKLNLIRARYEQALALVALQRALGN